MADPIILAVDGDTGRADSPYLTADALGVRIADGFTGPPSDLLPDLEAHARAASLPDSECGWRLADVAVLLAEIHGPDWTEELPTREDGTEILAPGSWQNMRTAGKTWPDRAVRKYWHERGLGRSHLSMLNHVQRKRPEEAAEWLERAAVEGWSIRALQRAVKGEPVPAPPADPTGVSLSAEAVAVLREKHEAVGIVLLSDAWYGEAVGAMLEVFERHGRLGDGAIS